MRNYYCRMALIACAALFVAAVPAVAGGAHFKTAQVQILYPSQIANGTELQPGLYKIEVTKNTNSPEVSFYRHNKLVAQTQAQVIDAGQKNNRTEVHYSTAGNQHVLTQLDLRGLMGKVVFNSPGSSASGS